MSVKSDLLKQIEKKAQKIRENRAETALPKTLEADVFDFFKNVETARALHQGKRYDPVLFHEARKNLERKIKIVDTAAKLYIEFNAPVDNESVDELMVRGVTIWWGNAYIAKNNTTPSLYIDVSQMLLF